MKNKLIIISAIVAIFIMLVGAMAWAGEKEDKQYLLIYETCNFGYGSVSCAQKYQLYSSIEEIAEFLNTLVFLKPNPIAIFKIEKIINFEKQIEKETVTRQEEIIKSERWIIE